MIKLKFRYLKEREFKDLLKGKLLKLLKVPDQPTTLKAALLK